MVQYLDAYIEQLKKLPPKTEVVQEAMLLIPSPGIVAKDIEAYKERSIMICASRTVNEYMKEVIKKDDHYDLIAKRIAGLLDMNMDNEKVSGYVMWKEDGGHFYLVLPDTTLDIRYDDEYVATLLMEI